MIKPKIAQLSLAICQVAVEFVGGASADFDAQFGTVSFDPAPTGFKNPQDYQVYMLQSAYDNWYEADCAEISDAYLGLDEGNVGKTNDGVNKFYWDDPTGVHGSGILAVTSTTPSAELLGEVEGQYIFVAVDSDITSNNDVYWVSTEEVDSGACAGGYAIEAVMTHEIGHQWGLDHTCEEGDACLDEADRLATMYWSAQPCDTTQAEISQEDINGINALYGPFATFTTYDDRYGGVPLEVCYDIETDNEEELTTATWNFGDGTTDEGLSACHTYTEQGQYTVTVTISGVNEACGDWEYTHYERAYVVACDEPSTGTDPSTGEAYPGLFTYEAGEDLTYQMVNRADTSVYGCLDTVVWQVLDSAGNVDQEISAWSPKIQFPSAGDHTVILNVGGPGGVSAAELTVSVVEVSGGCAAPVGFAGAFGLLLGLGAAASRRRR